MKLRTHEKREVSIISVLGQITYERYLLIPEDNESKTKLMEINGSRSIVPLDSYLGLSGLPFKITPEAMLKIAFWAQNQLSFQRAEEIILDVLNIKVNDDTVRKVADYVGDVVFRNDCKKAEEAYAKVNSGKLVFPQDQNGILYIQTDGAALNTRLRDEAGSTWRENKLGEIFSSNDIHYWTDKKGNRQHRILGKEYISYIGSVADFKKHLLACALRGGYGNFKETIVLSDGAAWIRNMVEEIFPDAQHILDYFHLCENVNTYAKYIFNMDEDKYKPWAKEICAQLKNGEYRRILKELESFKRRTPENCQINLFNYISNNVNNINYVEYEQKGYFIGSGAIESGNKLILQDRLKRSGMRWNIKTAQAILTLKAKAESNLWVSDVEIPFLQHCLNLSHYF